MVLLKMMVSENAENVIKVVRHALDYQKKIVSHVKRVDTLTNILVLVIKTATKKRDIIEMKN